MCLIQDAKSFIEKVLHPRDGRCCPYCGSTLTKRNGTRRRTVRDLGGIRTLPVQRHVCLTCKRSYSDELPEIEPYHWYTRRVQRTFLDMYTTIGGSLRRCAEWITAGVLNFPFGLGRKGIDTINPQDTHGVSPLRIGFIRADDMFPPHAVSSLNETKDTQGVNIGAERNPILLHDRLSRLDVGPRCLRENELGVQELAAEVVE